MAEPELQRLREENQRLLVDLIETKRDLDGVTHMRDWPPDTVLGVSGCEGIDCALSARNRLVCRLANYEDVAAEYQAEHHKRFQAALARARERLAALKARKGVAKS